ncbi:MAG TPA: sigma-70 family RNA polymerase sigma factor [Acidimicrobiales bacterium]|nr:sigma-70 family RNA polymerase sigma factor [Acidimicrobiales bacterium]
MSGPDESDGGLLAGLRAGDEEAFRALVTRHHGSLVRVASMYVRSTAVAEEVAQETWLAVIRGLDRFEERSSLRTWIFRILVNQARTRGARESSSIPFSSFLDDTDEPTVDPHRFNGSEHRWPGHWVTFPERWSDVPAERLVDAETRSEVDKAIRALPDAQRAVITLRDVEGWSSAEVCAFLGVSEVYQRVLLHRARARVRAALETYLEPVVRQ